ncbi:MAG: ACP phosphodiesterase [Poseidonibacter sp.]|uniref:acyl carrier protein phosphodiesterase n=1 Tax=Poseidonibacter sp. TaxID=2321188 RepID=UPI00359CD23C
MNWLAHVFLSEQKIDFQIGNFLADPLKGRTWENASTDMKNGMSVHKIIDSYTDSHKTVSISKKRLREKGLLKPIIIDLTYDYFLTKNWDKFCSIPIYSFSQTFYTQANQRKLYFPQKANLCVENMINRDLLNKYHNLEQLKVSFERMDLRLSERLRQRETALSYFDTVIKNIDELEDDFLTFFPQLCTIVKQNVDNKHIDHFKI